MNVPPEPQAAEARRWLSYAAEDLHLARLVADEHGPARQTCALAQQSAEKALKSGLVALGVDPPKTHDLNVVLARLPEEWSVRQEGLDLTELTQWAVAARYPGDWEEPGQEDVASALSLAAGVVRLMSAQLGEPMSEAGSA